MYSQLILYVGQVLKKGKLSFYRGLLICIWQMFMQIHIFMNGSGLYFLNDITSILI